MKEHPILFTADMVQAILEGRKTQTRRLMKPQPDESKARFNGESWEFYNGYPHGHDTPRCLYGGPGDLLWVRETWDFVPWDEDNKNKTVIVTYGADGSQSRPISVPNSWNPVIYNYQRWRPSIHMHRWASRIMLEVIGIRVERLRDITPEDADREGCFSSGDDALANGEWPIVNQFRRLWDSIYAKRGYGWDANPWVWTILFRRVL